MAKQDDLAEPPIYDGFTSFASGVNTGLLPSLLPADQLAKAVNVTVRGGFPMPRPLIRKCPLDFGGDDVLLALFETGRYQGHAYYQPDTGPESLIVAIGGHLFQIIVVNQTFTVRNITPSHGTQTTAGFVVPAVGSTVVVSVASTTNLKVGVPILIANHNYIITALNPPTQMTVQNVDDTPGNINGSGAIVTFFDVNPATQLQAWLWQSEKWMNWNDGQSETVFFDGASSRRSLGLIAGELSAGRMGTYWKGRNWWVNPDGITFRAGDVVYSSSGTPLEKYRDAVLKQTQNNFLATASGFSVPGSAGFIQAMRFVNILDVSLGQGPLQVLTPELIFGCDAPVDSAQWQNITNPLLAVSQYANGGVSQWATQLINGDMGYRSPDGFRSLVIGRRDVEAGGNVPISREVSYYLDRDDQSLLNFCSGIFFDNRWVMTTTPVYTEHGVYHRGLVVLNYDIISNVRGKKPPAWEGLYTGVNTLGLVKGRFAGIERAFAFSFNTGTNAIELYEILPSQTNLITDFNGQDIPVRWSFESPTLFRRKITELRLHRLMDGEVYYDDLRGRVDFRILWRPDQHPCWIEWRKFSVCAAQNSCEPDAEGCIEIKNFKPEYGPALTLGEPPMTCDPIQNRPYREFYTCEIRVEIQGHCRFRGMNLMATKVPIPVFTAPAACPEPEPVPVVQVFRSAAQTYIANCPEFEFGAPQTFTVPEAAFTSTISQADADAKAFQLAKQTAESRLQCVGCQFDAGIELLTYQIVGYFDGMLARCANLPGGATWDGTLKFFFNVAPNSKQWRASVADNILQVDTAGGGQAMLNAYLSGVCETGPTDILWTLTISLANGDELWTGSKVGGGNPTGLYTQIGGCTPSAGNLFINQI